MMTSQQHHWFAIFTYWGQDKIATILLTLSWNSFLYKNCLEASSALGATLIVTTGYGHITVQYRTVKLRRAGEQRVRSKFHRLCEASTPVNSRYCGKLVRQIHWNGTFQFPTWYYVVFSRHLASLPSCGLAMPYAIIERKKSLDQILFLAKGIKLLPGKILTNQQ